MKNQLFLHELTLSQRVIDLYSFDNISNFVMEINTNNPRTIKITNIHSKSHHSLTQIDLKMALISGCSFDNNQVLNKWLALCSSDIDSDIDSLHLSNPVKAVFLVLSDQQEDDDPKLNQFFRLVDSQMFIIREFEEMIKIMCKEERQYQLRCKFEKMLRSSNEKVRQKNYIRSFQRIAHAKQKQQADKGLKIIYTFMVYYRSRAIKLLNKYFSFWSISFYDSQINKTEQELVTAYSVTRPNRFLLSKCFYAWRNILDRK